MILSSYLLNALVEVIMFSIFALIYMRSFAPSFYIFGYIMILYS